MLTFTRNVFLGFSMALLLGACGGQRLPASAPKWHALETVLWAANRGAGTWTTSVKALTNDTVVSITVGEAASELLPAVSSDSYQHALAIETRTASTGELTGERIGSTYSVPIVEQGLGAQHGRIVIAGREDVQGGGIQFDGTRLPHDFFAALDSTLQFESVVAPDPADGYAVAMSENGLTAVAVDPVSTDLTTRVSVVDVTGTTKWKQAFPRSAIGGEVQFTDVAWTADGNVVLCGSLLGRANLGGATLQAHHALAPLVVELNGENGGVVGAFSASDALGEFTAIATDETGRLWVIGDLMNPEVRDGSQLVSSEDAATPYRPAVLSLSPSLDPLWARIMPLASVWKMDVATFQGSAVYVATTHGPDGCATSVLEEISPDFDVVLSEDFGTTNCSNVNAAANLATVAVSADGRAFVGGDATGQLTFRGAPIRTRGGSIILALDRDPAP